MTERLALVLVVCLLSLWRPCMAGMVFVSDSLHPQQQQHQQEQRLQQKPLLEGRTQENGYHNGQRACTLDELLPLPCNRMSSEWSDDYVVEPPYDCTCASMKARYFCPDQGDSGYPKWVPRAVASGSCASTTRQELDGAPLPPKFKVLFYGNSHLRQVVEAMMCMFQGALTSKRVTLASLAVGSIVQNDSQCRACYDVNKPDSISNLQGHLLNNGCIAESDTCRCDDDFGEFFFDNGATAHYTFAHKQHNKGLSDARREHRNEALSSYDVVFMNHGNPPSMGSGLAVATAVEVQNAGAQLFWLSTYEGGGGFNEWPKSHKATFIESGAKYLDVGCMMRGMHAWTKGQVEGGMDIHFCLPGPPNEIAVLALKLMWAVHDGVKRHTVHEGGD